MLSGTTLAVSTTASITIAGAGNGSLQLSGDSASPGNNYVYATDGSGTKGWRALSAFGTTTVAGTAGQVLVNGATTAASGAVTLTLATALVSINSVTSVAGQNLTLGLGTGGTALTLTNSTLVATFAGQIAAASTSAHTLGPITFTNGVVTALTSATAPTTTNLTLAGGSSGASLVLGQGANGAVTITPKGTGRVSVATALQLDPASGNTTTLYFGTSTTTGLGQIHADAFNAVVGGGQSTVWASWGTAFPMGVTIMGDPISGGWNGSYSAGQKLEVATTNLGEGGGTFSHYRASAGSSSFLSFKKSNSDTLGTHAAVASADSLGGIDFYGSDGTAFQAAGSIAFAADAAVSSGVVPGRIEFYTATTGGVNTKRATIDSAGKLSLVASIVGALEVGGTVTSGDGIFTLKYDSNARSAFTIENTRAPQIWTISDGNGVNAGTFSLYDVTNNKLALSIASNTLATTLGGNLTASGTGTHTFGTTAGGIISLPSTTGAAATGGLLFGADTNLYRSAANTLKTDDSLVVTGGLSIGITSTATAAGTTTLLTTSPTIQVFTGTTTQTCALCAANGLGSGISIVFIIKNRSSGIVTVQRSGSDTIENSTTFTLYSGDSITLCSDAVSNWAIV